ncbi:MAG TPA: hypothetical protein VF121_08465, partial [Thermoanaerobaculia bacterium]|nr:hypothetical protein [Thermoanaerobaculia bacterium]
MAERHPSREHLARFVRGELAAVPAKRLVRHLLAGCGRCLAETRRLWTGSAPPGAGAAAEGPPAAGYGGLFVRLLAAGAEREAAVAREQEAAPRLAAELLRHPPDRRLTLVANCARFASIALCEHLLESAAALAADD